MYEIGLKLWSVNTDHYLREAKRLYEGKVFDYIELFVVPDTLHTLAVWQALKDEIGIPFVIHNAHSATGFNLADARCRSRNAEIYSQTKIFADTLDAGQIIFHSGVDGDVEEVARQLKSYEEPRALLENKPCLPLPAPHGYKICQGATYEEISHVMGETGCGFCLDIGHAVCSANTQGLEPYTFVERLNGLHPAMYHLSDVGDMTAQYDAHPHLGTGMLDIGRLCDNVFHSEARISIETCKLSKTDLHDYEADVKYLRDMEAKHQ